MIFYVLLLGDRIIERYNGRQEFSQTTVLFNLEDPEKSIKNVSLSHSLSRCEECAKHQKQGYDLIQKLLSINLFFSTNLIIQFSVPPCGIIIELLILNA